MGLPIFVAIAAALYEQSKSGPPDSGSRDESPDAAIARNRIAEIMRGGDAIQTQAPQVPESSYKNPEDMDDLFARVQAMSLTDVVALHQRWESIRDRLVEGMPNFSQEINKAMEDKWEGAAAKSAADGIKDYVDKSSGLIDSVRVVAEKVKIVRSGIEVTQPAVQEPPGHTWTSGLASWVPGPTWKLDQHRDDAARDASVNVVKNVFYPAVREADTGVPLVPKPYNPAYQPSPIISPNAPETSPSTGTPSGQSQDAPISDQPADSGDRANETAPPNANHSGTQPNTTDQLTTTPANANPASTQPASTTTDPTLSRTGTPTPGHPNMPSPGPNTPNPGAPNVPGTPAPGRSLPGTPAVPGIAATTTTRPGTNRPGMAGMPGMAPPGARGKGDDEKEHQTKDYLVNQHNGEELTGLGENDRVKTVPPVIGE